MKTSHAWNDIDYWYITWSWTNELYYMYVSLQIIVSTNLLILTDQLHHSIEQYRTHNCDNFVWTPQADMVNKLDSIQPYLAVELFAKQAVENYLCEMT